MQKLIYVAPNRNYNDGVVLTAAKPFLLSSAKGLGGVETSIISSSVVGMQGSYYQGNKISSRQIQCTVYVDGKSREDMYRQRCRLIGLLTPTKELGTLYYSNDYISVKTSAVPSIPPDFSDRIRNYNKADITFWCPSPDWEALNSRKETIAYVEGISFKMPFKFPVSFSMLKDEIDINYIGTAPAPVKITIVGPAQNPTLTNETTDKSIGLLGKSLAIGEELIINTERGKKSVKLYKDGIVQDAFQYINPVSEFWQLKCGNNHIVYKSDDSIATRISIEYVERYSGV